MHGGRVELADVKALLSSDNPVVQSQGLSSLLSHLKQPFPNAKAKVAAVSLLFDCLTQFGDNVAAWCAEAIPLLLRTDVLSSDEVTTHCYLKLTSGDVTGHHAQVIIKLLLHLSVSLTSTCLTILRKNQRFSGNLVDELRSCGREGYISTLKFLLFSGLLTHEDNVCLISQMSDSAEADDSFFEDYAEYLVHKYPRRFIMNRKSTRCVKAMLLHSVELSHHELLSLELSPDHTFTVAVVLLASPDILMNEKFPATHVLLPSLFSTYSSRSELAKCLPGLVSTDQLNRIKAVVARCQFVSDFTDFRIHEDMNGCLSTFGYLKCIATKGNISLFLDCWLPKLDISEVSDRSVIFLAALFPYADASGLEKCCGVLGELIKRASGLVNSLLLLFTTLYAKPYFKIDKTLVLKAIGGLFVNRFAVTPAVNFLSVVCRKGGQERDIAFDLLGNLVTKFPTAFDMVKPLSIPADGDPSDLLKAKLRLMTTLCVSTDRSDELLPSLSNLLKKDAVTVEAAISVVKVLCKEDILDVDTVRKQLGNKVRQPGFEGPLAGYCEILATAALLKEQDEGDLVAECVKELWEITEIRRDCPEIIIARKSAWTALACFDALSLISVISKTPQDWMILFAGMEAEERKGLIILLQKLVAGDLESLSRTLYTKEYIHKSALATFITNLHNALKRTHQEAPWFWSATLPLFSVIANEFAESGKGLQAIKLLRRVLREVHVSDHKVVNLFAGWRICVVSLLGILTQSSDPMKVRDQLVEECKRALSTTELSVNNVLILLAILAEELKKFGELISDAQAAADFKTSMRPWFVALLEFMFPTVFNDYVQKTQPLIQVCVNQRCVNENVARSALWMACQSISDEVRSFFDDKLIAQALDWRLGQEIDPKGTLYALLTGGTAEEPTNSLSISKIWLFSAALGANDLITNSLSRSIPPDQHIEDVVKKFEENRNANESEVVEFFKRIANVPLNTFRKYEKRLRKPLELIFNKGGEQLKRAAYEGLSHLASVSLLTAAFDLPPDYGHLPEDSILRAVIAQFGRKAICPKTSIHDLLPVLVDQTRSDGRHLPPMEWQFMLMSIDYGNDEEARLNLLKLAFQQMDALIIYELTNDAFLSGPSSSADYLSIVSKKLPLVLEMMPQTRAKFILNNLLVFAIEHPAFGLEILNDIDSCGRNQIVIEALISHLPRFESAADLLHNTFSMKCIDQRFTGQISRYFDFWLGCSARADVKLVSLVDAFAEEQDEPNVMLSIFGFCAMDLPLQQRLDKLVDLMSIGKVMLSCQRPSAHISAVLDLTLALICSLPADLPINWLSPEITNLLHARWRYYWRRLMQRSEFCQLFDVMTAFLFPCFLLDDLAPSSASFVKAMLVYILSNKPEIVRPYLEDKNLYWERLLL